MNKIGTIIDELIKTHIKLWHNTSPARLDKSLTSKQRVMLFMKTREFNVMRAKIRDDINLFFNSGYPDPKMNYMSKKEK